jgi:hypothetical protein
VARWGCTDVWEQIDTLLERAPHVRALRYHRLGLLEARRRRERGLKPHPELAGDEARAAAAELAVPALLARARAACQERLVLIKGPELALDYGGERRRPFGDLDLLADDAAAAQAALLAAGFQEVGDPSLYEDIHHLRPLWWPGLPLVIELHTTPKWVAALPDPPVAELLAVAVPSRLGVDGVETLPPAHHAVLLAAHAWAHEPLARLGHLLDIAVTLQRADAGEPAALARRWGVSRLWRTTHAAVQSVLAGDARSWAVACWGRHLLGARERTVLEVHAQRWLAPAWGVPFRHAPGEILRSLLGDVGREHSESWRAKLARTRLALANAGTARADHVLALEARGHVPPGESEG